MILAASLLWQTMPKEPPFAKEIAAFREQDLKNPPEKGQVLFVGSSSFTNWKDAQKAFPTHKILNRAFGGSSLPHVILYANEVIFKYDPKQVVLYCGENDLAGDPKLPAFEVYNRFVSLFRLIRSKLPQVPIAFVSMKPSPSRWHLRSKYIAGNAFIAEFRK